MFILSCPKSVIMVAGTMYMEDLPVYSRKCRRYGFPHLTAGLVDHIPVHGIIVILLDKIAGTKHGLDIQVIHIILYPRCDQIENRLIHIIFHIALRITEQDYRSSFLISNPCAC